MNTDNKGAINDGWAVRLAALLAECKPSYSDVGSRDVETTMRRNAIDEAIALLAAQPAQAVGPVPVRGEVLSDDTWEQVDETVATRAARGGHTVRALGVITPASQQVSGCKGKNCGSTDGLTHSAECYAEYAAAIDQNGALVAQPPLMDWKDGSGMLWDVYSYDEWRYRVVSPHGWDAHAVAQHMYGKGYAQHLDVRNVWSGNYSSPVSASAVIAPVPTEGAASDVTELVLRDVCETDPADPNLNDTVCIDISDLKIILDRYLTAAPEPIHASDAARPAGLTDDQLCAVQYTEQSLRAIANRREQSGDTIEPLNDIRLASRRAAEALRRFQPVARVLFEAAPAIDAVPVPASDEPSWKIDEIKDDVRSTMDEGFSMGFNESIFFRFADRVRKIMAARAAGPTLSSKSGMEQLREAVLAPDAVPVHAATVTRFGALHSTFEEPGFEQVPDGGKLYYLPTTAKVQS